MGAVGFDDINDICDRLAEGDLKIVRPAPPKGAELQSLVERDGHDPPKIHGEELAGGSGIQSHAEHVGRAEEIQSLVYFQIL